MLQQDGVCPARAVRAGLALDLEGEFSDDGPFILLKSRGQYPRELLRTVAVECKMGSGEVLKKRAVRERVQSAWISTRSGPGVPGMPT